MAENVRLQKSSTPTSRQSSSEGRAGRRDRHPAPLLPPAPRRVPGRQGQEESLANRPVGGARTMAGRDHLWR
eukprot:14699473-Alexandrium_andersonii.AAC.1